MFSVGLSEYCYYIGGGYLFPAYGGTGSHAEMRGRRDRNLVMMWRGYSQLAMRGESLYKFGSRVGEFTRSFADATTPQ